MELEEKKRGSVLGGALLVAGTAIGGGMLGLPVVTAAGGFFPAVSIFILCWLFMASTGTLLTEVFLWSPKEVNIVSMAKMTLGKSGQVFAWILYLFLFYSLTVAYVSGGGHIVKDFFDSIHLTLSPLWSPIIFVVLFAPFVVIGASAVDRVNRILMIGLILSFLIFVWTGFSHIDTTRLFKRSWPLALMATPVMFTSFGFQGIVPTLTNYLGRDPHKTVRAIWWGSALPLVTYIIWELLIVGVVPLESLEETLSQGQSAVFPLKTILDAPWLYRIGEFFAFFAIVTSFLGVTLGLYDFLADGLKIKKEGTNRLSLCTLIFLPPLLFSLVNPDLFLDALQYAGGIGCALLLGLLPILMAWSGRYFKGFHSLYSLPGGRFMLTLLLVFIIFELYVLLFQFFN